jgi:hypothetical protein
MTPLRSASAVKLIVMLVGLALAQLPHSSFAQTSRISAEAQKSIVYIYFDVTDPATGAKATVQGTGVVVSASGYVLTASHLFRNWQKQTEVDKRNNPIRASLKDKPGYVAGNPLFLNSVNLGNPDAEDVALLRLPSAVDGEYEAAQICLQHAGALETGDDLIAFGFPEDHNFQPVPGTLGTSNGPGGRWAASSAFTHGMSGGPVYDAAGFVVGIVKGGLAGTDAVRWITPIQHAVNYLNTSGFQERCSSAEADGILRVFDAMTGQPLSGVEISIFKDAGFTRRSVRGVTDVEGTFSLAKTGGTIFVQAKQTSYVESRRQFNFTQVPSKFDLPMLQKALDGCRTVALPGFHNQFVVSHFRPPLQHNVSELDDRIREALDYNIRTQLQKLRLRADSQPSFKTCSNIQLGIDALGKSMAQVLGVHGLIFGTVAGGNDQKPFKVNTYVVDSYGVFESPVLTTLEADLENATSAKISVQTRAAILGSLAAGLKEKGKCADAITVIGIAEELLEDSASREMIAPLSVTKKQCQDTLIPLSLLQN